MTPAEPIEPGNIPGAPNFPYKKVRTLSCNKHRQKTCSLPLLRSRGENLRTFRRACALRSAGRGQATARIDQLVRSPDRVSPTDCPFPEMFAGLRA